MKNLLSPLRSAAVALTLALAGVSSLALAQGYPSQPIRLIVPWPPGGGVDTTARMISQPLSQRLGQPIYIDNKAGAGGNIGTENAKIQKPDGYTLLMGSISPNAVNQHLYTRLGFDPIKDFTPITFVSSVPNILVVPSASPYKTVKDLLDAAKASPGKLTNGHGGVGATSHVSCLLFTSLIGGRATLIGYRGSGPALNDLITGQYDFMCDQIPHTIGHVEAGSIRILAVAQNERAAVLPNVPTTTEAGLPLFQASGWNAMFAPKGTPKAMIDKLADAASKTLDDPTTRKRLEDIGAVVPPPQRRGPQALRDFVASEIDKWTPVIKASGVALN